MESKAIIKIEIDDTIIKAVWAKTGDDGYRRIMLLPGDNEALIKLLSNIILTHTTILKPRRAVIEADMEVDDDKEKN